MPLSSLAIHTTHQHFQKRYITLFLVKGLKSYEPRQKCKMCSTKEYKDASMLLSSLGIHTTHQHFQKRHITLFLLKGLKGYQPSKYKCSDFLSKTHVTYLLWLITFEPLEQKQSYIPLLKVLLCGMNVRGAQWHNGIFVL